MSRTLEREEPNYFGAGPALLPTEVLNQAAFDLLNFQNGGLGVGEISHRSKPAAEIIQETKQQLKELLSIPDTHEVFFMQGGGTTGFSSIATNLIANYAKKTGKKGRAAYAVTGSWSKKAAEEAQRLGFEVDVLTDSKKSYGKFGDIQPFGEWEKPKDDTAYLYVCDNETVNGVELQDYPEFQDVELVSDMSSNFLSKTIDVSKYGVIMAGAQKNVGLAGLTIYIIKKTLIDQPSDEELNKLNIALSPIAFHYPTVIKNDSAYNTIPIFTLYIIDLVLKRLIKNGGLSQQQKINEIKAAKLYAALDKYPQLYKLPVTVAVRSKMNVVFTIDGEGKEEAFLKEAAAKNLAGLKGHRSVGGMRASLYNAVSEKSVQLLIDFVEEFAKKQ